MYLFTFIFYESSVLTRVFFFYFNKIWGRGHNITILLRAPIWPTAALFARVCGAQGQIFSLHAQACILKCLNWQSLHEFSLNTDINVCCSGLTCACAIYQHLGDDGINAHNPAYTLIERVNGLSMLHLIFFIAVVMYWEARMHIHQQKHSLH